ncbi:MAG: putative heme transporter [Thermoleophilaceae bacterium]|nr:putative heme transporter [Thermoleophilaceae bacterium]
MTPDRIGDRVEQAIERRAAVEHEIEREPPPGPSLRRTAFWLVVTGVSLYLVAPSLIEVLGSWSDIADIAPLWLVAMLALQVASTACLWALQRIALHTDRWAPVITSQLASNALSKIAPGGGTVGAALQYKLLVQAGFKRSNAVAALTATNLLVFGVVLALPVLALPAIVRGGVNSSLVEATVIGLVVFALLFAVAYLLLAHDRPLVAMGRGIQALRNRVRRGSPPVRTLPVRLLSERNRILATLGPRRQAALLATVARWAFDYASLLAALAAVGSRPRPVLVLLAFCAAQLLTQVPITPGGLGFVEAGMTAMLTLAGVPAAAATLATFAYRLFSYWLPMPVGLVAIALHRRRHAGEPDTHVTRTPGPV